MTPRTLYWCGGTLFLISQAGYFSFLSISPNQTLVLASMIGSNIGGGIYIVGVLIQSWPPKNTMRRMVYWFGSILFVVLQADFSISAPHSALNLASLIGSVGLVAVYLIDQTIQNRAKILAVLKKLRRPPID
jgi:hypothetical protein